MFFTAHTLEVCFLKEKNIFTKIMPLVFVLRAKSESVYWLYLESSRLVSYHIEDK